MIKLIIAEFIGTFVLIFLGCASGWVTTTAGYSAGPLLPALAHGLALVFAIYSIGHISGAHVNPAVTIGVALTGNITINKAVVYVATQLIAATVAAFALSVILPGQESKFGGFSFDLSTVSVQGAFLTEFIMSFILVTAVLNAAVSGKAGNIAGLAIGLTLTACIPNPVEVVTKNICWVYSLRSKVPEGRTNTRSREQSL